MLPLLLTILSLVAIASAIALVIALRPREHYLKLKDIESEGNAPQYRSSNLSFSIDPEDTGIERRLWGVAYTLPRKDRARYLTMNETPYCVDPVKEEQKCAKAWNRARVSPGAAPGWDCGPEIPYEYNKI